MKYKRLEFRQRFGTDGVVILPVIHVRSYDEACKNIAICQQENAPGAFLINHDFRVKDFIPLLKRIRAKFPDIWLGVNLLGYNGVQTFQTIEKEPELGSFNAFWCDNGMIDVRDEIFEVKIDSRPKIFVELNAQSEKIEIILVGRSSRNLPIRKGDCILEFNGEPVPKDAEKVENLLKEMSLPFSITVKNQCREDAKGVLTTKAKVGYSGLYFGGVAFKGQAGVSSANFEKVAAIGKDLMDAVVTSGKKTGSAIDLGKLQKMRLGFGNSPLLVASGVNLENFMEQASHIDGAFVATGISKNFYNIDATKLRKLLKLSQQATLDREGSKEKLEDSPPIGLVLA